MNLKDFYSQEQVMKLLGFKHRMQVTRWREKYNVTFLLICEKPFYVRSTVDRYLDTLVNKGTLSRMAVEKKKLQQIAYDVSMDEYLPRCKALEYIKYKKSTMYNLADKTILELIRTKKVYGFMWFNKQDLEDFLVEGLSISDVAKKRNIKGKQPRGIKFDLNRFLLDN